MRRSRRVLRRKLRKHRKRVLAAGTAAAITLSTQASIHKAAAGSVFDPHRLGVAADTDGDLLADSEEAALFYARSEADQNRNGVIDGVELAVLCAAAIKGLPLEAEAGPGQTYKKEYPVYGMETCEKCGVVVNMGYFEIIVPGTTMAIGCPFISLHYMEHGSFSYAGDVHTGRVDVPALVRALDLRLAYIPDDHQLTVANDSDGDLLANEEEGAIGYGPFTADQNRNEIPDGVELAKRCADAVEQLPVYRWPSHGQAEPNEIYKLESPAVDGMEYCHVCGELIYMGGWYIINPRLHLQYPPRPEPDNYNWEFLPELAIHYMQHGSFDYLGDVHTGRVEIDRLLRTLELRYPYRPNDHQLPVDGDDHDGDLLADAEELAAGLNLHDPDQDDDLTPDGIQFAKQCGRVIDDLPEYNSHGEGPPPATTYKVNHFQKGLEQCGICGASRNMGYWVVVNPALHLSIEVPDITCHYMEHGSFSYAGSVHGKGRMNVPLLAEILRMPRQCGHLGVLYLPGDNNKDCREDFADLAQFAEKWLESTDP
jgi:hypothetical protein